MGRDANNGILLYVHNCPLGCSEIPKLGCRITSCFVFRASASVYLKSVHCELLRPRQFLIFSDLYGLQIQVLH
ncbi:hypothetical protein J6590_029275 [Homalodisca vitripennis]|nr:hypothetical protein J6590_029275 [Homalodisca vitripennis]